MRIVPASPYSPEPSIVPLAGIDTSLPVSITILLDDELLLLFLGVAPLAVADELERVLFAGGSMLLLSFTSFAGDSAASWIETSRDEGRAAAGGVPEGALSLETADVARLRLGAMLG